MGSNVFGFVGIGVGDRRHAQLACKDPELENGVGLAHCAVVCDYGFLPEAQVVELKRDVAVYGALDDVLRGGDYIRIPASVACHEQIRMTTEGEDAGSQGIGIDLHIFQEGAHVHGFEVAQVVVLSGSIGHVVHGAGDVVVVSFAQKSVSVEAGFVGKPVALGADQEPDVGVFLLCLADIGLVERQLLEFHAVALLVLAVGQWTVLGEAQQSQPLGFCLLNIFIYGAASVSAVEAVGVEIDFVGRVNHGYRLQHSGFLFHSQCLCDMLNWGSS